MFKASIIKKLTSLSSVSLDNCCIYKIPEFIRKEKIVCYRPSVISIGPVYYQDPTLKTMQELKWNFLKGFLQLPSENVNHNIDFYVDTVRKWENKARECYQEKISLTTDEFVQMILLDAAFIIYLFMAVRSDISEDSPRVFLPPAAYQQKILLIYFAKDLFLLENQLPFFILKDIYDIAFGTDDQHVPFDDLTRIFIGTSKSIFGSRAADTASEKIKNVPTIKHLVDFLRICCLPSELEYTDVEIPTNILSSCTAKELRAAGVKFVASESKNPLDIKFDNKNGVLEIPKVEFTEFTESVFRSIIFFEQNNWSSGSYINDYLYVLDKLIDTVEDVRILIQDGILFSMLDEREVVDILTNVTTCYVPTRFYYADVSRNLKEYASTPWNQWKATLKMNYFQHPWAIISVIYAVILFILTLLQTIASFIHN